MKPLRCACLVAEEDGKVLLVRVRQNEHWYLPGGKIEPGETAEQALRREVAEELGINIDAASVYPLCTVVGPAYGMPGDVELVCFTARWKGRPRAQGEISELRWWDWHDTAKFAPAVQVLFAKFLQDLEV